MNATTRLAKLAPITVTLLALSGCDDGSYAESLDEPHVEFRNDSDGGEGESSDGADEGSGAGGDRDGPDKLNTSFLGDDQQLPLNNIPRALGAEANVELLAITSDHCTPPGGASVTGEFTTEHTGAHLNLSLSTKGELGGIRMSKVDDPSFSCLLSGNEWEDTYWSIRADYDGVVYETDLWLADLTTDEDGYQLYRWYVNYLGIDPIYDAEVIYFDSCDADTTNSAEPGLEFYAYMVKDLHVDESTGDFTTSADTMYMACLSGSVGKAMHWRYKPDTGYHELATRMIRADYCGDGTSHTQLGTNIWLNDLIPIYGDAPPQTYAVEAQWSVDTGAATCVGTPRLATTSTPVVCDMETLPDCDDPNVVSGAITTHVPLQP